MRNGVHDYFRPLNTTLIQESDKVVIGNTERPRKKKRYTRHRALSTSHSANRPTNSTLPSPKSTTNTQHNAEVGPILMMNLCYLLRKRMVTICPEPLLDNVLIIIIAQLVQ